MNEIQALHAAARRYCKNHIHYWHGQYAAMGSRPNEESALATYPRYNVLGAILQQVEQFVPEDFKTLAEARERLAVVGHTAESPFTMFRSNIAVDAMQDERHKFTQYVRHVSSADLLLIEPLPYRRAVVGEECQALAAKLKDRWGADVHDYWHPLIAESVPAGILVFHAALFERHITDQVLRDILIAHGITRLWEIREGGSAFELDTPTEFCYTGDEGYWTSGDMDWLIYASHESSITFAGDWLISELKRVWPDCEQNPYTDPYTGWDQA